MMMTCNLWGTVDEWVDIKPKSYKSGYSGLNASIGVCSNNCILFVIYLKLLYPCGDSDEHPRL